MTPAHSAAVLLGDESRKQRRRECHNQVEKRRREHINAMIEELNKLLPTKFKMPMEGDIAVEDEDDDDPNPAESPVKKKVLQDFGYHLTHAEDEANSFYLETAEGLRSVQGQNSERLRTIHPVCTCQAFADNPVIFRV